MPRASRVTLPKIQKVVLNRFSLYTLQPNIEINIPDGVFCLAGANGLGKSTFLASVNYGITGIVRDPARKFESIDEYYKYVQEYGSDYFEGRISETDRDAASIRICLQVGNLVYDLSRGFFETEELRELKITLAQSGEVVYDGTSSTSTERHRIYQEKITQDIGLGSFQQFVFLQLFVFTFDESRHLLLWDKRALNLAVHLCLGADFQQVQKSDLLFREMQKADSLARNYAWRASSLRSEIAVIRESLGISESQSDLEELGERHKALQSELDEIVQQADLKKNRLSDAQLKWTEANAELGSLQAQFNKEFSPRIHRRSRVELHPLVATSISDSKCVVCGSRGERVGKSIENKVTSGKCPLCDSALPDEEQSDAEGLKRLKEIDVNIAGAKKAIANSLKTAERLSNELQVIERARSAKLDELNKFESENDKTLYRIRTNALGPDASLQNKLEDLGEYQQKKKNKYAERDRKKGEYLAIQRELEQLYLSSQDEFVPLFRDLAFSFLGIDVDVELGFSTSTTSPGVSLTLGLRGTVRRQDQQLSESQRFFIDIALRMAIAEYISGKSSAASLFIDTPEGSLDIAYESRVGQMFAQFVNMGNHLLMTANINSSQILLRLASECGREKMSLHKMTTWTELSEVQAEEEPLFLSALKQIEKTLDSSTGKHTHGKS